MTVKTMRKTPRAVAAAALVSVLALTACGIDDADSAADAGDTVARSTEQTSTQPPASLTTRTVTVTDEPEVPEEQPAPEPDPEEPEQEPDSVGNRLNPEAVGSWMRNGLNMDLNEAGFGTLGTSNGAMNTARYNIRWSGGSSAITVEVLDQIESTGDGAGSSSVQTGSTLAATLEGNQLYLEDFNGPGTRVPVCKDAGNYSDWAC